MKRAPWLPVLALVGLAGPPRRRMQSGFSRGEWRALPDGVEARLVFDRAEVGASLDEAPPEAAESGAAFGLYLAHSSTLALSSSGMVVPRGAGWSALALSITYVGLENLTRRAARPRFFSAVFAFGLVHGFGFAGALAGLGLPAAQTPGALFAFNAGVELGQLGVLAVAFPLIRELRDMRWFVPGLYPRSASPLRSPASSGS